MLLALTGLLMLGNTAGAHGAGEALEGLWDYTGLVSSQGEEMPLTGVILFKDGLFLQQSVFNGEPFDEQGAMAHAGTYSPEDHSAHLVAEQTIATMPGSEDPLSFRSNTEHEISVERHGDEMTVVFGSGTVQTFERIADADGRIYRLRDGMVAFLEDYFVLVSGTAEGITSGYGRYEQNGESYDLHIVRWAETDGSDVTNRRDGTIEATFDGEVLRLEDGPTFRVRTDH